MRKFKFQKLVRDKIVEGITQAGNFPHWRILSDEEFVEELKKKVSEEAKEIPESKEEELVRELADLQEIIDNLLKELGVSKEEFANIQEKKNNKAGSFKDKHFIDYVETKEGSEWVEYYMASPEKYPEIK